MPKSWWVILLASWLLIYGLLAITNIEFQFENFVVGVLAVVTAITLFLNK